MGNEEIQEIFRSLKEYRKKYRADYYCVILTPPEGQKIRIPGNAQCSFDNGGRYGAIIKGVVEKEVLFKPRERE